MGVNIKLVFLNIVTVLVTLAGFSQIEVSQKVQYSKITQSNQNKLYFIDFWATWCGPCVYANEYLTVLQKQFSNDFYVVSLSEENSTIIKKHLQKHPSELAVFSDFNSQTMKKFGVQFLPYGVLIDAHGNKLWEGSPTDFKPNDLQRFLRRTRAKANVDDTFVVSESNSSESPLQDYKPTNPIEIKTLNNIANQSLEVSKEADYIKLQGNLKEVLSYLLKVHVSQLQIAEDDNGAYQVYVKKTVLENAFDSIVENLGLIVEVLTEEKECLVMDFQEAKLWDTSQIDWGEDADNFLIGDTDIQANNVYLNDLKYRLSLVLNLPVKTINVKGIAANSLHDWQVHYRYFSLMEQNLLDVYGIKVEKKNNTVAVYQIKKAPK
ncbi:TlpA family protein disulfide reductase [Mangrovimonas spongiae]|uniref:TlpA family protein disulfide reductase n=1 Tax=Mangrovimonas spongiae TaxID=2494697 RepID=A0A428K2P9_9FLAO|nr:TlpA disulfide reductase family protein [Mangrovimonas spongiae]RSK40665.1 TlpA family protein disulfide reductase [Mangrovimonas spongiae]